jgi:hypothetical protein
MRGGNTRRRGPKPGRVDGRPIELSGQPGEAHSYVKTPMLAQLRQELNITDEDASEALRNHGGFGRLRQLENGGALPAQTVSRICAVLGDLIGDKEAISHAKARGEV